MKEENKFIKKFMKMLNKYKVQIKKLNYNNKEIWTC